MIKVEIACNSYASCLNAVQGGADRIELFENLADGGCTPSAGMIRKVKDLTLPCYVMIRPRGGNFCYTNDEIDIMLNDIEFCKKADVAGIVFGCLTSSGAIDKILNKKLLAVWNGPATFHRAIDRSDDILKATHEIVDIGFERILSSGAATHVLDGLETLKKMQASVGQQLTIMPGAGVTSQNAKEILQVTGCKEIHATCKKIIPSGRDNGGNNFQDTVQISDLHEIEMLMKNIK